MVFTPTLQMSKLKLREVSGRGSHGSKWQRQGSLTARSGPTYLVVPFTAPGLGRSGKPEPWAPLQVCGGS